MKSATQPPADVMRIKLSEMEKHMLQQMSVDHQHRDIRTRAAGLLLPSSGLSAAKAAAALDVSAQSIYNWSRLWVKRGLCGLQCGQGDGGHRASSKGRLATAIKVARTKSMTLGQIAKRVKAARGQPMPRALETSSAAHQQEGFEMKSATLDKLQCAARANAVCPVYLNEAGFAASPPVQAWSPRGLPHCAEPRFHCRRSVLGALDFGKNTSAYHVASSSIKSDTVIGFIGQIALQGDERPTIVVLDNASIHHSIDSEVHERWLRQHGMQLFCLPPYSPELNLIEIVWKQPKYRWLDFGTWTKETIENGIRNLSGAYGTKFQLNFA